MTLFLSEAESDADLFQRFGYMFMNYSFVVVEMGSSIGIAKDFNFKIHNKSTTIQRFGVNEIRFFERNQYVSSKNAFYLSVV